MTAFANPAEHFKHSVRWRLHYARRLVLEADDRHRAAKFYHPLIRRGSLVFDIGGNAGSRAILFAHMGARVITLEPVRATYDKLAANVAGLRRVTALNMGASDHNGTATISVCNIDPCSSMEPEFMERIGATCADMAWVATEQVRTTTLDDLISEYGVPSFIKIDVEGHEAPVLRGLSRPVDALSFEYSPFRLAPAYECLDRLDALGEYEYNLSRGETFRLDLPAYVGREEMERALERQTIVGDVYARRCGA
jgi:FkbM family methyltransferase